jgi:hypothetical protein
MLSGAISPQTRQIGINSRRWTLPCLVSRPDVAHLENRAMMSDGHRPS